MDMTFAIYQVASWPQKGKPTLLGADAPKPRRHASAPRFAHETRSVLPVFHSPYPLTSTGLIRVRRDPSEHGGRS